MTKIYFDVEQHKYTDNVGPFTSVTTVLGKYGNEFDAEIVAKRCEQAGKNPESKSYEKYKGKTAAQIMKEWDDNRDKAASNGTAKHDYIEKSIMAATGHKDPIEPNRLFTIEDVTEDMGVLDIEILRERIGEKYPEIFQRLSKLAELGFRFFAEICVFNLHLRVSGLIDLLLIKDDRFIVMDWKTNRDDILYESGFTEKLADGTRTGKFKTDNKKMKEPLAHLADSVGNHYNLQIGGYAWLMEQFGYKNLKTMNTIFQIRDVEGQEKERVDVIPLFDYRDNSKAMFLHHMKKLDNYVPY